MSHHCHAQGCRVEVKPELLMCSKHWLRVPGVIRREVLRNYRPGQCDDKNPSEAWHVAADAAIGFIAIREARPVSKNQVEALAQLGYAVYADENEVLHCMKKVPN